ncbi:MAG: hypothetical protein GPOALKHO_001486 [Sodalis sp.]|nr:MAG: hypothetical protein GPOALKHO_001486 [Sodalis sp.]
MPFSPTHPVLYPFHEPRPGGMALAIFTMGCLGAWSGCSGNGPVTVLQLAIPAAISQPYHSHHPLHGFTGLFLQNHFDLSATSTARRSFSRMMHSARPRVQARPLCQNDGRRRR